MEQVVYGDVLLLINFSMDFLSLYICSKVLHKKINTAAFVVSALLGGVYAVASLFILLPGVLSLLLDVLVAFLMCVIAFEVSKGSRFSFSRSLSSTFVFFVCQMLLGGTMTALFNFFGRISLFDGISMGQINSEHGDLSFWLFVFLAISSTLFTYVGGRLLGRGASKKTVEVKIENGGNALSFSALVDSGNLLSDPISGKPVVVIGLEKIKNFLPRELRAYILDEDIEHIETLGLGGAKQIRFIPASGVGKSTVLVGFVPERMVIFSGKKKSVADAVVAIEKNASDFGGCDAILPSRLINV